MTYQNRNLKPFLFAFGLILSVQVFFGPAAASGQMLRERVVKTVYTQQEPRAERESDVAVKVRYALLTMNDYTVFDWLEARADADGRVTLLGHVTDPALRTKAARTVAAIEGVGSVRNRIEVLPDSGDDLLLRKRLYSAIYNENSPLYRYAIDSTSPIHIVVRNGSVTLFGDVDNPRDRKMVLSAVRRVRSVARVTSRLRTNENLIASAGKTGRRE